MQGLLAQPDDLSTLQFVDPEAVRSLANAANDLPVDKRNGRKLVLLLATGGTLAMHTESGIRIPELDFMDVLARIDSTLHDKFDILGLQLFNIDSSQMDYRHTRELAIIVTYLWRALTVPFEGFLITHGTDTMSYSSAAMSLMMGPGLPFSIVYTGAQRPILDPMTDAPINIRNALYTLEALHEHDMAEVLIVMGDCALLGVSSEKIDDMMATAFRAPRHRHVANFSRLQYPVSLAEWLNPRRRLPFAPTIWTNDFSRTLVIKSTLGLSPDMVAAHVQMEGVRAIILYSYGAGTVHESVLNATFPCANERKIPVFIVNPVHSDYRIEYLSNFKAIQLGAIPLDMTLSAALAKIEIALSLHPDDPAAMASFMTTNYVGEIPSAASRFIPAL